MCVLLLLLLLHRVKRVYDLQATVTVALSTAVQAHATETRGFVKKAHDYSLFTAGCLELSTGNFVGRSLTY